MNNERNIKGMLAYIDPANTSYREWIEVGMAIKAEGLGSDIWDEWSQRDAARYKPGDCSRRWETFTGEGMTGATITHMAKQNGWKPSEYKYELKILDFDAEVSVEDAAPTYRDPTKPTITDPVEQAITYIKAAFRPGDRINILTHAEWDTKRNKWVPAGRGFTYPYEYVLETLKGGLDNLMGDRNKDAGVWIRANPLDGNGSKNENTAAYRHCLVESDSLPLEKQIEIYKRLNLPITCLTLSGGKSVHALVKVEAADAGEFKSRVRQIFDICQKEGLDIDGANKNPARLTRLAGCERGDKQQSLLAVNIGATGFHEWIENVQIDDLPEYESLSEFYKNPPELPPETIKGVLRKGEKLVLTGPSKAGKSFALIQLAVALATGSYWMGRFKCSTQRVVYINLELTKENSARRLLDVWKEVRRADTWGMENLSIWNLRGSAVTTKAMVDSIIKRHKSMANPPDYYIVDPIYKINAGDENAAKDVNELLREFDRLCAQTNANLVYAHHHAKGSQFGKRALDRGSGSGVIGRDADAAIDLDFLFIPEALRRQKADYYKDESWNKATGLRVEMTLRNFESKPPFNVWFKYPVHIWDSSDDFQRLRGEAEKTSLDKAEDGKKRKKESTDDEIKSEITRQIDEQGFAQIGAVEENVTPSRGTINRFLKESDEFQKDGNGKITRVSKTEKDVSDT